LLAAIECQVVAVCTVCGGTAIASPLPIPPVN
jgi:hypothetical protein